MLEILSQGAGLDPQGSGLQESRATIVSRQQPPDFGAKGLVARAGLAQPGVALAGLVLERGVE
ncbi:MAG TPA: hypothetical protein VLA38_03350 [Steroidobacteraceae bacterium]|nr:hypothetical protein [Xanthomonadales bacterium]HSF77628.1 hypothetical protein [Steroidobacteraceae bacterium]